MLCRKFKMIPITIVFFANFLSCSKIEQKSLYYSTGILAKFRQKWLGENSPFLYFFLIHIHVFMLCKKFKMIPITIVFFANFLSCSKIEQKSLYYSTGILAKFRQKWLGENSPFLYFFLIHIHVFMLCKKFKMIPITIVFFTNFLSCSKIEQKSLYYSTGILAKFRQKWLGENSPFLYFSLIHIHVFMLCRKFKMIPITIVFFTNF